jgi:hypothetical protein
MNWWPDTEQDKSPIGNTGKKKAQWKQETYGRKLK